VGRHGPAGVITALVDPGTLASGHELHLGEAESHHLRVRRVSVGSTIHLMDGRGGVADGVLLRVGDAATVRVGVVRQVPRPAPLRLVVGAGDRERFGWLAEKAAELGVTELVPLETSRTAGVSTRVREAQIERLQRRALEAIKQSGAAWAPRVSAPVTLEQVAADSPEGERWLADAAGEPLPGRPRGGLTAVIGPEGGLTDPERDLLLAAGFRPIRLGPHVLRFETAALAVAVLASATRPGADHD
jgi:16S rRNA (uracil1498-N3)-methyltransferase